MKFKAYIPVVVAALLLSSGAAFGQEEGGRRQRGQGGQGGQGGEGGRGGNPEEFRQRMNDRLKESLKASDEEWTVIQPLLEKVTAKQRETAGGRMGGMGGRGGRGGRGGDEGGGAQTTGASEAQALRTALENEGTSPEELKTKLTAVREARKKATAELAAAREALREVLTVRQEAALVSMGVLE